MTVDDLATQIMALDWKARKDWTVDEQADRYGELQEMITAYLSAKSAEGASIVYEEDRRVEVIERDVPVIWRRAAGGAIEYALDIDTREVIGARIFLPARSAEPVAWPVGWAFREGDMVRKKSGSWFEGEIVGFYSTRDTPRGYAIQMQIPTGNGPVQIFPEAALEIDPTRSRPE